MKRPTPPSSAGRPFVHAPDRFDGTLEDLYERFVQPNLPEVTSVRRCHALLREYVQRDDPLFLVRQVTATERGETYRTSDGSRFMATDNAPAWWMHYITFRDELPEGEEFARAVESAPYHFFEVARRFRGNISAAGWHVAHILAVKDRNTNYESWSRSELRRRFIRNAHPCNHFLVPKSEWQRWGGDPQVIAFFAAAYRERYSHVWPEFLALADGQPNEIPGAAAGVRYVCDPDKSAVRPKARTTLPIRGSAGHDHGDSDDQCGSHRVIREYYAPRLLFRADVIEALQSDERFRVITPVGAFEMSKAEFYSVFPNVAASASYRERRLYHYPRIPAKALAFLRTHAR